MKKALLFSSSAIVIRGAVFLCLLKPICRIRGKRQMQPKAFVFRDAGESRVGKATWRRAAWRKAKKCYGLIVSESDASDRQSFEKSSCHKARDRYYDRHCKYRKQSAYTHKPGGELAVCVVSLGKHDGVGGRRGAHRHRAGGKREPFNSQKPKNSQ